MKADKRFNILSGIVLIAAVFLSTDPLSAQVYDTQWGWSAGGSGGESFKLVKKSATGSVYAFGDFNSSAGITLNGTTYTPAGGYDMILAKFDDAGNPVWFRQFQGADQDYPRAMAIDNQGNVYVTGSYTDALSVGGIQLNANGISLPDKDVFVAKIDSMGNAVWAKGFGGNSGFDDGYAIALSPDQQHVYVAGAYAQTWSYGSNSISSTGTSVDAFVLKLEAGTGTMQKLISYGGSGTESATCVVVDDSEHILVAGLHGAAMTVGSYSLSGSAAYLGKFDSSLNVLHAANLTSAATGSLNITSMLLDSSSNLYVAAYFTNSVTVDVTRTSGGGLDGLLFKTNENGVVAWSRAYGGTGHEVAVNIALDGDKNVYTCGYFQNSFTNGSSTIASNGGTDMYVTRFDSSGNPLSAIAFGGTGNDHCQGIFIDSAGDLYMSGYIANTVDFGNGVTLSSNGFSDFVLAKLTLATPLSLGDVSMGKLSATKGAHSTVALSWETYSENNNSGFSIQRSLNGKDFISIGFVAGKGQSTQARSYQFTDPALGVSNTIYYRLFVDNADNRETYSNTAIIQASDSRGKNAVIYPNPVHAGQTIYIDNGSAINKIEIYCADGRLIYTTYTDSEQAQLSLSQDGIYLVKLYMETGVKQLRLEIN